MLDLGYEEGNASQEKAWEATEEGRRIFAIQTLLQRRLANLNKQKALFFAFFTFARTVLKSFVAMFIGSARFEMNLENTTARPSAL